MSKGEQTRQIIIQRAAALFNQRGYAGASMQDVMEHTGLQKGGIYRHFTSKDELAHAAFDYAQRQYTQPLEQAMRAHASAPQQLLAFIHAFHAMIQRPPVPGGCPVQNTLVEADDSDTALCQRALAVLSHWGGMIEQAVAEGIRQGSIRPSAEPRAVAAVMLATLEGAILLSKSHNDLAYAQYAVDHMVDYVQHQLAI